MIDIRPRKASPILKRKTKPKIPKAILNPFFLKKLIIGPPTVPLIHATDLSQCLKSLIFPQSFGQFLSELFVFQQVAVHEQTSNQCYRL